MKQLQKTALERLEKNFSEDVKMLPGREKGDNLAKEKFL